MKIVAVFNCDSWLMNSFGGNKLRNSWSYFHPDITIIWYNENDTNRIIFENPKFGLTTFMPIIMLEVKKKYNADLVIKLDADSIVLDRFSEIIDCDDDTRVFGVRNDGDHIGNADERQNRPRELWDLPNEKYINCGCLATSSEEFLNDWLLLNKLILDRYGSITSFWMCEQNMMNMVFYSGKYKTKILDPKGGDLFYGTSANGPSPNNHKIPEHIIKEWNCSNWQSWRDIEYKDGKFWLYGKQIKISHMAGGGSAKTAVKLSFDMFNPKIIPILQEITKCNE
ncbi:MAG: hypothetical protein AABY22_15100 [Nanoarchaeota archaeon]